MGTGQEGSTVLQVPWDTRRKPKTLEVFWGTASPQYEVSLSRGPEPILQTSSKVQGGAGGGSARTAGTQDKPQLQTLHLHLAAAAVGGFPQHGPVSSTF